MNERLHHLQDIISNRRTIKPDQYTGERVDDLFIRQVLEAANWAPTHGYTEPWRFTVFSGDGLATLGEFLADQDQPDKSAEDFNQIRYDKTRNRPLKASHVIGIGLQPGKNEKVPEIEEIASVAMAVQNMWLMTYALGLGAYWSTGAVAFTDAMRSFLGFNNDARSLGLFYIGKPAIAHPKGRRLSKIDEKIRWVKS